MSTQSTLLKLWDKQKWIVTLVSAIVPILTLIGASFLKHDKNDLMILGLGLFAYQVAFLIALVFETQRLVANKKVSKITKIQLNDEFWQEGAHYEKLYLNALNGNSFFEMITNHQIRVDDVRIIAPTNKAIETYYENDAVVSDRSKSAKIMEESIQNISSNLIEQMESGKIKSIKIKRLGTFPLDFYAIFDSRRCLVGKYQKDPQSKNTVGVKSLSWMEENPQLVKHHEQHFEMLWNSLPI